MKPLATLGAVLLACVAAGLALHIPGAPNVGSIARTNVFVAVLALAGAAYLGAVAVVVRRLPPRGTVWLVLGVALAMRLPVLFAPPFLSSDVYRYVWDGEVQNAGANPYRYVPADPALAHLRDTTIYPHVSRAAKARTIYPPFAEAVFALVARVSPTMLAMKAAMLGFELAAMAALVALLDLARLPRARLLIYAWNPLAVWTIAGNGHVDAIVVGTVSLALLAAARRWRGLAGALLGAAVVAKFMPAAILPALWRRWDWRLPAACAVVIAALYALYLFGAGGHILGYLPGYASEEGIVQGGGIWLLAGLAEFGPLPPDAGLAYGGLIALALLALAVRLGLARRPADPARDAVQMARDAAILACATLAAISPHYPWYFVWLAVPCCLAPLRSVVWLSVAPLLLTVDPLHERFVWPALLYIPAMGLALLDARAARVGRADAGAVAVGGVADVRDA
jgi:alpha-1,6-mannosyltransferase